jgi:hypothetical protein
MDLQIAKLCELSERVKAEASSIRTEREEAKRAQQATNTLLLESMTKRKVDAVAIHGSEGTTYARLCPPPVKYAKMQSFEDISTIFNGLETHLAARLDQDVVEETCHFFSVRSRTANPNGAHRIRIVKRLPEGTNVTSEGEPARLAQNFDQACRQTRQLSERSKPLREELKKASQEVAPALQAMDAPARVVARDGQGNERGVMNVCVASAKPPSRDLGTRRVSQLVRSAAVMAARTRTPLTPQDAKEFEEAFMQRLRAMVSTALEELRRQQAHRPAIPKVVVKREK